MDIESNKSTKLRCLFIGPIANHAVVGRIAALIAANCDVFLINAGFHGGFWLSGDYLVPQARIVDQLRDPFFGEGSKFKIFILEYLRSMALIPEDRRLTSHLRTAISTISPHFVVCHYGQAAIHYSRVIKRLAQHLPVIDIVNLLPSYVNLKHGISGLIGIGGKLEDLNYRHWIKQLDAVIFASQEMQDFATNKFGVQEKSSYIFPDYLPIAFQGQVFSNSTIHSDIQDGNPKVVFFGAPERYGHIIDSLDHQFMGIASEQIHIYSGTISDEVVSTGFGHQYPKFTDQEVQMGRLAEFGSQFDAALITYEVHKQHERFRSTYPTRFFAALAAGIPIAVRAGFFDACERFVIEHKIGFTFVDAADLRRKLMNKQMITACHFRVQECKKNMNAEAQGVQLRDMINSVLERGRVASDVAE